MENSWDDMKWNEIWMKYILKYEVKHILFLGKKKSLLIFVA